MCITLWHTLVKFLGPEPWPKNALSSDTGTARLSACSFLNLPCKPADAHAEQALRHASTALRVIEQDDWSPLWQKKLIDAVSQALKDALTLESNEAAATAALGILSIQGTIQHIAHWKTLADMLPTIGGIDCTWILDHQATSIVLAVRDAVTALQDYQTAEAQLSAECRQQYAVLLELAEKLQNYGNAALQHEDGEMDSARMESIIRAIVSAQSPVHTNALAREVARQLGFKRTGNRIQAAVERIAHDHVRLLPRSRSKVKGT